MEEKKVPPTSDLDMLMGITRHIAGLSELKKHGRSSTTQLVMQETLKERMMKTKEERQLRFQNLQMTHRHICDMVGIYLGIDSNEVLDGVADDELHLIYFDEFLNQRQRKSLMFYYQDGPHYSIESGRHIPTQKNAIIKRLYITPGVDLSLDGICLIAYKTTDKEITLRNINDEVFFAQLDMNYFNGNAVAGVHHILSELLAPAMEVTKDWGDLPKSEMGLEIKKNFQYDFEAFVKFLQTTKTDLDGVVAFPVNKELHKKYLLTSGLIQEAASNPEICRQIEAIVRMWSKKIERALVQYQQLRRENEFVGPLVEIEYWRRQLACFTSIIEFIRSSACIAHVQCIETARLKLAKVTLKQCS